MPGTLPFTTPAGVPDGVGAVLTIDRAAVVANWRQVAARVGAGECAAVVKADAYGLGAARIAPALAAAGCRSFFVAHPEEALALRAVLPVARIAVLHGVPTGSANMLREIGAVPVLNSLGDVTRWRDAAQRHGTVLPAIIHFDTGMNRLGLPADETANLLADPGLLSGIKVQAWMTHFACPDVADHPLTRQQAAAFQDIVRRLPPAPTSLASSSAIFRGQDLIGDLARPGIALYGGNPTPEAPNPMAPVVGLHARILQVHKAAAGTTVGYGASHRFGRDARVAVLSIGYGDGFLRAQGNAGRVRIGGYNAPVVGRVSMDLTTVDVTDVPEPVLNASPWAAVIDGKRGIDAVAESAGTIGYEVLTGLGRRYHRVYLG